jgi:chromosomal replication initiator protein
VSKYFNLRATDLKSKTRQQRVVRARGVAMFLARQLTANSLENVGRHFGNRDHTTVLHACRKTRSLIETDPSIRQAVDDLTSQLTAD